MIYFSIWLVLGLLPNDGPGPDDIQDERSVRDYLWPGAVEIGRSDRDYLKHIGPQRPAGDHPILRYQPGRPIDGNGSALSKADINPVRAEYENVNRQESAPKRLSQESSGHESPRARLEIITPMTHTEFQLVNPHVDLDGRSFLD